MKDLGLSKNLISAVSGIMKTTAQQQQEQSQQQAPSYSQHYGKLGAARPLSIEDAKAATEEAHAPARRVAATIRGMYVKEDVTEAKKDINDPHEKETLKKRKERHAGEAMDEAKAHTVPNTEKEKSLAKLAHPKDKITHKDVMVGRGVIAKEEVEQASEGVMTTFKKYAKKAVEKLGHGSDEDLIKDLQKKAGVPQTGKKPEVKEEANQVEEGWDDMLKSVKEKNKPQPNGGAGKKEGSRYGGSKQKEESMKEELNTDTPGNSTHQCAVHVKHSKLGEGRTLFSQHAQPAEDGSIEWYDVMFEHGIEKKVPTVDLEILVTESHMNHKKKK